MLPAASSGRGSLLSAGLTPSAVYAPLVTISACITKAISPQRSHERLPALCAALYLWWNADELHAQVGQEEYNTFFTTTFREFLEPLAQTHFSVEGTIEFSALLFVPGMAPFEQQVCTALTCLASHLQCQAHLIAVHSAESMLLVPNPGHQ